eukprot:4162663-Pleurochrysis_carterae.AAC.1
MKTSIYSILGGQAHDAELRGSPLDQLLTDGAAPKPPLDLSQCAAACQFDNELDPGVLAGSGGVESHSRLREDTVASLL